MSKSSYGCKREGTLRWLSPGLFQFWELKHARHFIYVAPTEKVSLNKHIIKLDRECLFFSSCCLYAVASWDVMNMCRWGSLGSDMNWVSSDLIYSYCENQNTSNPCLHVRGNKDPKTSQCVRQGRRSGGDRESPQLSLLIVLVCFWKNAQHLHW